MLRKIVGEKNREGERLERKPQPARRALDRSLTHGKHGGKLERAS